MSALARIRTGMPLRKMRNHGHGRGIRSPNSPCTNLAVAVITPAICDMRSGHPTTVITSAVHFEEAQAACDRDGCGGNREGHPIAELAEYVVPPAISLPAAVESAYVVSNAAAETSGVWVTM